MNVLCDCCPDEIIISCLKIVLKLQKKVSIALKRKSGNAQNILSSIFNVYLSIKNIALDPQMASIRKFLQNENKLLEKLGRGKSFVNVTHKARLKTLKRFFIQN